MLVCGFESRWGLEFLGFSSSMCHFLKLVIRGFLHALWFSSLIIIIIILNLIYIVQFNTSGILTALYIVITYIQKQYVHR